MPAVSSRSLPPHGMPCKRPAVVAGCDLLVRLFGLGHGQLARRRDHAKQCGIEPLYALQINIGKPFRGQLAGFDPP